MYILPKVVHFKGNEATLREALLFCKILDILKKHFEAISFVVSCYFLLNEQFKDLCNSGKWSNYE